MVEKLKSILRQTNWSLVLRAVLFALAWWALPFWLFLIIAIYLYYVPIAGAGKVAAPFWVLIVVALFSPHDPLFAIVFGAIFYTILLVKDLLIIDRRTAYEVLILVLSYLLLRNFFLGMGDAGFGGWSLFVALFAAWLIALLFGSFIKNFSPDASSDQALRRTIVWITFILVWQLLIVGLFLPINFLYQGAFIFLITAALMDLLAQYAFKESSRVKTVVTIMIVFTFLAIVAASARWAL